jgi:O-antigen/teichoic acid export membrane protein
MPADEAPVASPAMPPGPIRRLLARGLVRAGLITYAFAAVTLVANLVSGIVTARALGPDGRGITVALSAVAQLAGFVFAMGVAQSLSYFIARRPQDGPRLFTTWLLMLLPLTALAIVVAELLLTTIFAVDGEEAIDVGRWFMFTITVVVGLELNFGLLLGAHDFLFYNALRLAQPALAAASFVVLWWLDALTVVSSLVAATAGTALVLAVGMARAVRKVGIGPPDVRLGLRSLWYGVRGQGVSLAANVNARLDLVMLPAFVAAAGVGLYSVATNVSLSLYQFAGTFAALVLPAAARDEDRGTLKVVGSLYATLAIAGLLAVGLGLLARPLLGAVYGDDFRDAAEPLRLILPGAVLFAASQIAGAGLYAAGRPFTATIAQLVGMVITVAGLSIFLRTGGITAAAIVSSVSYGTVFAATLIAYKHVTGLPWRALLPGPAVFRALTRHP